MICRHSLDLEYKAWTGLGWQSHDTFTWGVFSCLLLKLCNNDEHKSQNDTSVSAQPVHHDRTYVMFSYIKKEPTESNRLGSLRESLPFLAGSVSILWWNSDSHAMCLWSRQLLWRHMETDIPLMIFITLPPMLASDVAYTVNQGLWWQHCHLISVIGASGDNADIMTSLGFSVWENIRAPSQYKDRLISVWRFPC